MRYTILGAEGFIGRALQARLQAEGHTILAPDRDQLEQDPGLGGRDLGHVLYCIGVTADFRSRVLDALEAHVCLLRRVLQAGVFVSLTYLSSVRVYSYAASSREDASLWLRPDSLDSLYNQSKLLGESACLHGSDRARVVRLSHVYGVDPGSENFLSSVLQEAALKGKVTIRTSYDSAKDYISLQDVARLLPLIAARGELGIYNLATGENLSNQELAALLRREGIEVDFARDAPRWSFPEIDVSKLGRDFYLPRQRLKHDLPWLLQGFGRNYAQ